MATPVPMDSRARAIWNAALFWLVGELALPQLLNGPTNALVKAWHLGNGLTAANTAFFELETLVIALILTAIFGYFEGRRVDSYGLPIAQAFRGRFWEGFLVGVVWAGIVALLMIALGGMRVYGLALHGGALLWMPIAWFFANVLVGLGEEAWFRGYLLQTLRKGIGFWAASVVLSLWFVGEHYFFKTGENVWDCITLFAFGMLICFTVLRTGSLWFAVGLHVSFDYMQLFVIGTRNGALVPAGHLLNATFQGPAWINGGVLGTEASVLMYPLFIAAFIYVAVRFPVNKDSTMVRTSAS